MKSTIRNNSILSIIILITSCSPKLVQMSILKIDHKYIEVKNGDRVIFSGFTGGSNMTEQNAIILVPINYRDSIFVEVWKNNEVLLKGSYKLTNGKYLYIDNLTGAFSVYSQNKVKPLI